MIFRDSFYQPNMQFPTRLKWFNREAITSVAGWTLTTNTNQIFLHYCYASSAANGDIFTWSGQLRAGYYTLSILGVGTVNSAIADIYWDNNLIGTQDWYSSTTYNVIKTIDFLNSYSGNHILKAIVNGRNGSSTNWRLVWTYLWIIPKVEVYP